MCYPKPGPRCSNHAAAKLTRIKHALREDGGMSLTDHLRLKEELVSAQREYDATPAGIQTLKLMIANSPHAFVEGLKLRLDVAERLREEQLRLLKEHNLTEEPHETTQQLITNTNATQGPHHFNPIPPHSQLLEQMVEESTHWGDVLTDEEKAAITWYTHWGARMINNTLRGKQAWREYDLDAEQAQTLLTLLDSAANKMVRTHPAKVYSGAQFDGAYNPEANKQKLDEMGIRLGATYTPGVFVSASLDPQVASKFSNGVVFEYIAKTGGSIVNFHEDGLKEREMLLPRDKQYKVTQISKSAITYVADGTKQFQWVVRLEEQ